MIELWIKGWGLIEPYTEERIITCKKLLKDQTRENVVYADGRKIEFNHCQILRISTKN